MFKFPPLHPPDKIDRIMEELGMEKEELEDQIDIDVYRICRNIEGQGMGDTFAGDWLCLQLYKKPCASI